MRRPAPRPLRRLAGAVAATGLALAGLVVAAAPASAAACSGTSGVTVVVDTGSSVSTKCASGDPSSALKALTSAGFSVTYPQQYPGSVVCRINGYPSSDPCVRMPPGDAYWAFFHAKRGGSWVYSSSGVASYDPAPGTVVGFRFGSGQQPRVAPPAPTKTSTPVPTKKPHAEADEDHVGPQAHDSQGDADTGRSHLEHRVDAGDRGGLGVDPAQRHVVGERHGIRLGDPVRRARRMTCRRAPAPRHPTWRRRRRRATPTTATAPARSSRARRWCCSWPAGAAYAARKRRA